MSTPTIAAPGPVRRPGDKLVPIEEASGRLGLSALTLKRRHAKGQLPLFRAGKNLFAPESFLDMVFASMRPGHAPDFAEVASAWFAANHDSGAVAS